LKSPLRLIFRSGKDVRDLNDLAAATTDLKTADAEISFTRKADFRDLKVSTTVKAEYDGFMWYELQLSPAKKPVHIDALTLELPLSDAMAKLMIPYDYSLVDTGKIHDWRGSNRPLWGGTPTSAFNSLPNTPIRGKTATPIPSFSWFGKTAPGFSAPYWPISLSRWTNR